MNLEHTRDTTSTMNMAGVQVTADDGAVGITVLFPNLLLQPSPSQMEH